MQYIGHRESLVFTEVEHLDLLGVTILIKHRIALGIFLIAPNDTTCEVDIIVHLRELSQRIHIVFQRLLFVLVGARGILVELSHQHAVSGLGILIGTVGLEIFLHLTTAIELISGGKIAALHLAEDGTGINQTTLREVEVDARTKEFLSE